jgi:hypothetical protein
MRPDKGRDETNIEQAPIAIGGTPNTEVNAKPIILYILIFSLLTLSFQL